MGLFGRLANIVRGKADEAVEKIEDENLVMLAKQQIDAAKTDMNKAIAALGQVKGTKAMLEGDLRRVKGDLEAESNKAKIIKGKSLAATDAGNAEEATKWLTQAQRIAEGCVVLKTRITALESQITAIQANIEHQDGVVRKLRSSVTSGEYKLQQMKANEQVTKAQEALSSVNTDGSQSALTKFDDMLRKQETKMHASTAMLESQGGDSAEVESALKEADANSFLDSL